MIWIPYNHTRKCILITKTKTQFYEFLAVMCCISLNMHILRALSKFKISIIKIPKDSLYIFLVLNAVFITVYHIKAVQDNISAKSIPIGLQNIKLYTHFLHLYLMFFPWQLNPTRPGGAILPPNLWEALKQELFESVIYNFLTIPKYVYTMTSS